jgi:hypothetical protein
MNTQAIVGALLVGVLMGRHKTSPYETETEALHAE